MVDHGDFTRRDLPAAERAVRYLLDRIRLDPDLRWLMLDTQAFALLCDAEAKRTELPREEVEEEFATAASHRDANRISRLECHQELVQACEEAKERLQDSTNRADMRALESLNAALAKATGATS